MVSGENLRSIGPQMRPQRTLISVRSQNILCWKLDRGCHFDSNGSIYIFNFIFLYTVFLFCYFVVVVVVVAVLKNEIIFYIFTLFFQFSFLFNYFLISLLLYFYFLLLFYFIFYFLIGKRLVTVFLFG